MATTLSQIDDGTLERAAKVIKCLGHPLRLRLVELLDREERSVTEIAERLGAGQAAVSHQLAILRGHGVVEARRAGAFVHYRITEPKVRHILDCIRHCDGPASVRAPRRRKERS